MSLQTVGQSRLFNQLYRHSHRQNNAPNLVAPERRPKFGDYGGGGPSHPHSFENEEAVKALQNKLYRETGLKLDRDYEIRYSDNLLDIVAHHRSASSRIRKLFNNLPPNLKAAYQKEEWPPFYGPVNNPPYPSWYGPDAGYRYIAIRCANGVNIVFQPTHDDYGSFPREKRKELLAEKLEQKLAALSQEINNISDKGPYQSISEHKHLKADEFSALFHKTLTEATEKHRGGKVPEGLHEMLDDYVKILHEKIDADERKAEKRSALRQAVEGFIGSFRRKVDDAQEGEQKRSSLHQLADDFSASLRQELEQEEQDDAGASPSEALRRVAEKLSEVFDEEA